MRVRITPERLEVTPGVPATFEVSVYNTEEIIEGFVVRLAGLDPPVELTCSPRELSLFPDTEGTATATFTLPRDFRAGDHSGLVEVTGTTDPRLAEAVPLGLAVAAVSDAGLTLEPQSVTGGRKARFTVVAENRGNVSLSVSLSATDAESALRCRFAASELEVPPGRRVRAGMIATGRRPFLGAPAARILTVRGSGPPAPASETLGTFIQKPLVPRALLTLFAILLALGLWGTVLFRGVNRAADKVAAEIAPKGEAVIVGRVTDGTAPLGGVAVTAKGNEGEASTTTLTSGDVGAFTLAGLGGPDTYLVTATMEGFATQTALVPVPGDKAAVVQVGLITLGRGSGSVTGTVTVERGGPLGGVAVTVSHDGQPVARSVTETEGSVGFYSVGGLVPPGPYLVTFERAGFVSRSAEVSVTQDAPAPLDVALVPATTSSITGLVTFVPVRVPACGPGECPLADVAVTVTGGPVKQEAITASTPAGDVGRFTVTDLPSGSYTLSFAKDGFVTQTLRIGLEVDQPVTVDVTMQGTPGMVSGTASGCTAVDARRRDLSDLDPRRTAVPAEDGSFVLDGLPTPGEYRLVFRGPQLRTVDLSLGPGEKRVVASSCGAATTTTTAAASATTTSPAPPPAEPEPEPPPEQEPQPESESKGPAGLPIGVE